MADLLDVTLYGNDAAECTRFIRTVRKYARASGKVWDHAWIAEQVYDAFDGRALHWYLEQPQNVQQDWALLQTALIKRWPLEGDEAKERQAPNVPTSAPAAQAPAHLASSPSLSSMRHIMDGKIGQLRVRVGLNHHSAKFLSKQTWPMNNSNSHMRGAFMLTPNKAEAQTVKLTEVKPDVWRLGLENHPSSRLYIAAYAFGGSYKGTQGVLVGVDATNGKPIRDHQTTHSGGCCASGEFWTDVWQFEDGRYLALSGPPDAPGEYKVPLVIRPQDHADALWFRGDHTSDSDQQKEVEFEFEPIMT